MKLRHRQGAAAATSVPEYVYKDGPVFPLRREIVSCRTSSVKKGLA